MGSRKVHLALLAFLVILTFANTLPNRFNIDDSNLLLSNRAVHGLSIENIRLIFTSVPNSVEYLPLRDLSYCLDYELWGLDPFGYHLSNLAFYLAACLLLYVFLREVLEKWTVEAGTIALASTAIFAVHPVHVESVAAIAQRKDLLSGVFFFLSLWAFMKYKFERHWSYYVLSLVAFVLAMLSKATAVVLPLIVVLMEFVYFKGRKKRIFGSAMYFVAAVVISVVNVSIASSTGLIVGQKGSIIYRVPTAFRAVFYYLKMLFLPYPLRVWHEFGPSESFFELSVLLSLAGLCVFLYFLYRWRRGNPVLSFFGVWYLVCLAPVVGLLPTSTIVAERYLFLPSAGFAVAVAWLLHRGLSGRRGHPYAVVIVAVVMVFAALSFDRNRDWKNNETLMLADLEHDPDSVKLNVTLGRYHFRNGRYGEAFAYFRRVKEIESGHIDHDFFLAVYLYRQGKFADALAVLDGLHARQGDTNVVDVLYMYGRLYEALGRYNEGRTSYLRALKSNRIIGVFFKSDVQRALDELEAKQRG